MSRSKLFLIDGHSYSYRAYYAIRSLSNSRGEPTNAIYGFVSSVRKVIEEHKPEWVAVCFDRAEPTFRHEKFEDYKAHREPMPDDLIEQMDAIKEFCRVYNIAIFEKAGYEADDIIGTLARQGEEKGLDVFLLTGDKDAMQLVNPRIKMMNPNKDNKIFDTASVKERYAGLGPEKVIDIMALMGDSSDNVPGVPGIGEKTAVKLIQEFGSVENLLKHADKVSSKSQREKLKSNKDSALMSKELVTIDVNVPLKFKWDDLERKEPDTEKLSKFFQHYEFRSQLKDLGPAKRPNAEEKRKYELISDQKQFKAFLKKLEKVKAFSFDTETTSENPISAKLVGMSFSWEPLKAYYVPVSSKHHSGTGLPVEDVLSDLKPILESKKHQKFGHNIKYDWIVLKRAGILLEGITFDTMIASYLVNPAKFNHNLDDVTYEHLGFQKIETVSLLGKGKAQVTMDQVPVEKVAEYAGEDADCVFRLVPILKKKMKETEVSELFEKVEVPLLFVLGKMEMNGVFLDVKFLEKLSKKAASELDSLTGEIYDLAGMEFNINSPKQLQEVLFDRLKLPVIKKTKTGYSTDVSVLEKLAQDHELPQKLLEFREKMKLKSTYLDALPAMIDPETGAVHTSYHQTTTATGRLSSSAPNLQNIPIKTEAGRLVRKAFVPRPFKKEAAKILSADYSQIELRILAHLCGDKNLTKAFREDLDVHNFTAMRLYEVKEKDVTREMRNAAKTINFSIIYGKTAYGLSQDLGISVPEADGFIENYFKRYKAVKDYLEAQKEKARKQTYLTTILGRRSYFPDINSRNYQVRQFAERAAINAPIQGSAADLIKVAMIRIQDQLEQENFKSLMTMQVHDELVFDLVEKETETLRALVIKEMEGSFKLKVPLKVDVHIGDTWFKN